MQINVRQRALLRVHSLVLIDEFHAYLVHCNISKLHVGSQEDPPTLRIRGRSNPKVGNGDTRLGLDLGRIRQNEHRKPLR